jgi:hypothetical protein
MLKYRQLSKVQQKNGQVLIFSRFSQARRLEINSLHERSFFAVIRHGLG